MGKRREFLGQLAAVATAMSLDAAELRAASKEAGSKWDTSWLDELAPAKYRVVFNASSVSEGAAMSYAAEFFDQYHEVHDAADKDTRPVIVFRRMGTVMALNDAMWAKYAIGESRKITDSATHAPAVRNVFWKAAPGASPDASSEKIDTLRTRGLISLVCNIALGSVAYGFAERTKTDVEAVQAEVRANIIPGAFIVPSGIFGLIRAQNAGCAYMEGT
jgi:intracellular sulfur oxidation DsrE/DsrF family protein